MGKRQRFTREALYDLVWEDLASRLAQRFRLSDVGFASEHSAFVKLARA